MSTFKPAETTGTVVSPGDTPDEHRARLDADAAVFGWELQERDGCYRLADASTGTLVAATWTINDGYGFTLAGIDDVLAAQRSRRGVSE
jgi:hypothetical protein